VRTAVDTNVLLDVFTASPRFGSTSGNALRRVVSEGSLVACDVVWAEVRAHFESQETFEGAMSALGVAFDACDEQTASAAGQAWRKYHRVGGRRTVIVPDFLVASHAAKRADRLLSRDRGFTRRYFPRLILLDPSRP
jgi:hypothetical protein